MNPRNKYILSLYYLGDPEGAGLGAVLNLLQEEGSNIWSIFFLAGLGWALRDNMPNARTNLQRSVYLRRANGQGRLLPSETWYFFVDLLEEEKLAEVAEFFEVEEAEAEEIAPSDDAFNGVVLWKRQIPKFTAGRCFHVAV